jgi:hypothetical protein
LSAGKQEKEGALLLGNKVTVKTKGPAAVSRLLKYQSWPEALFISNTLEIMGECKFLV